MKASFPASRQQGFSLVEILVTVAVIGILTSLALVGFGDVSESARLTQAKSTTAKLNAAVKGFNQSNWDIPTAANDSDTTDEILVLRSLQYKPSSSLGSFNNGAPFYPQTWNPASSSSTKDYRVRWNGFNFELLELGAAGKGLKIAFDGTDQSAPQSYPSNYKLEGAR